MVQFKKKFSLFYMPIFIVNLQEEGQTGTLFQKFFS